MHFIRISPTQLVNLEQVARVEINISGEIRYTTLYFLGGNSYRCTEEESEVLLPILKDVIQK